MSAPLRNRVGVTVAMLVFALAIAVEPAAAFAAADEPSEGPSWLYALMVLGLVGIVAGVVIGRRQQLDDDEDDQDTD